MNKIEKLKQTLHPAQFTQKLPNLDYSNLSEADRFYLKNFGIYNIKLRPENFMIRIRFDGLSISKNELQTILNLKKEFNLLTILTARGGLELHSIRAENIYQIYKRLRQNGVETHQSLTDNFRAIVTDPFADLSLDSGFESLPIIKQIRDFFIDNHQFFGMIPRKFNTALISREKPVSNFWGNDALFALAKKDGTLGFNLYLGGKNSEVAKSANIFITPEQTKELFIAIAQVFLDSGFRGSRAKTRLFHLIETIGMDSLRKQIETNFTKELESEGELLLKSPTSQPTQKLKDGLWGERIRTKYGEISTKDLERALKMLAVQNSQLRLGVDQNLYLITPQKASFKQKNQSKNELEILSCVGARYCPLSLWDVKGDIDSLPIKRLTRLGVNVGFSGCLKGCGRHYHSDIGLIGLRTNLYAPTERAFRVFFGAVDKEAPARMLYYSVPQRETNALIEVILDDFEESRFESFRDFSKNILNRYKIETLQLWYLVKSIFDISGEIKKLFFSGDEERLIESFDSFLKIDRENINQSIKELSHTLWDLR